MHRFRSSRTSVISSLPVPELKKKALNSWAAVQDTFYSTKDIFERHRVVFTISTSIASVATAWAGYSIRVLHQSKVDQKLDSIEKALQNSHHLEHTEIKKIAKIADSQSTATCFATAGTTLLIGYALGWRGGRWYANRKFRKEQMKMLGQMKPRRWQLLGQIKPQFRFLRRPLTIHRAPATTVKTSEKLQKDASASAHNSGYTTH